MFATVGLVFISACIQIAIIFLLFSLNKKFICQQLPFKMPRKAEFSIILNAVKKIRVSVRTISV